jgi:DNA modification methylase
MNYELHNADCIEAMSAMPAESVHTCVTSPPYFGLRDYGHDGQVGLEQTPDEYVAKLVAVFRKVRRVLREDGTCWLNLGDSYARTGGTDRNVSHTAQVGSTRNTLVQMSDRTSKAQSLGLKEKDLIGIPWRVAFALQADGWYLRQDIIWHKPNPMPESVTDRCTKAHEYIFLLSKSARYYYDGEAVAEWSITNFESRQTERGSQGYAAATAGKAGQPQRGNVNGYGYIAEGKRNRRSVWTVATKPFSGAHFAVFPPDLIEPCILAGCPEGGTVLDPFTGSGTTGMVALEHGRRFVGCELNPEYAEMARGRMAGVVHQPRLAL